MIPACYLQFPLPDSIGLPDSPTTQGLSHTLYQVKWCPNAPATSTHSLDCCLPTSYLPSPTSCCWGCWKYLLSTPACIP
jgi:hypothetical protein